MTSNKTRLTFDAIKPTLLSTSGLFVLNDPRNSAPPSVVTATSPAAIATPNNNVTSSTIWILARIIVPCRTSVNEQENRRCFRMFYRYARLDDESYPTERTAVPTQRRTDEQLHGFQQSFWRGRATTRDCCTQPLDNSAPVASAALLLKQAVHRTHSAAASSSSSSWPH